MNKKTLLIVIRIIAIISIVFAGINQSFRQNFDGLFDRNVPLSNASDDKNKVVFVGGYHLDDLKNCANSIEFK